MQQDPDSDVQRSVLLLTDAFMQTLSRACTRSVHVYDVRVHTSKDGGCHQQREIEGNGENQSFNSRCRLQLAHASMLQNYSAAVEKSGKRLSLDDTHSDEVTPR